MKTLLAAATYLCVAGSSLCAAGSSMAAPPPASAFGRVPAIADVSLSPDGQRIAILGGASDQRFVSIATIDQPGLPIVPLGNVEGVDLAWAGDEAVIARVAVWGKLGPREEYRFERNIAISPDGKVLSRLLGTDAVSQYLVGQPVLGTAKGPPLRVMVGGLMLSSGPSSDINTKITRKGVDNPFISALWSVDPVTGRGALSERGDYDTVGWDVDVSGEARVRRQRDQITHLYSLMGRAKGAGQWSKLWAAPDDGGDHEYFGYSDADDAIYVVEDGAMSRIRLSDGVVQPVGGPFPGASISLLMDDRRKTATGFRVGGLTPAVTWLDPEIGGVHATLAKAFKGKDVHLQSWSDDRSRFAVEVEASNAAPAWYLFDKAKKQLSPLGDGYPELAGVKLGTVRAFSYKARDGLDIPAYLTLPPGAPEKGGKLPLVLLPHGGPSARDEGQFDFIAQFLASRGYAVLQPQFRGSWGFGRAFNDAGLGEWGGKMQTDLLDGIASLAASGDIDPARVCIVGASYGGYAALAGLTLHPEAYRCGASIAGVADLGLLLVEEKRVYGADSAGVEAWRKMLGNAPVPKLAATSPAKLAANVRAPLLLIHGDKDTVVPLEQSQVMATAMKAAGKPVEFVTLVDENHYLTKSATRTQMLEALDVFLAKNLPVQTP
jgi:dipeptidyl aminopeptidase/acylaminoacyl peptidase